MYLPHSHSCQSFKKPGFIPTIAFGSSFIYHIPLLAQFLINSVFLLFLFNFPQWGVRTHPRQPRLGSPNAHRAATRRKGEGKPYRTAACGSRGGGDCGSAGEWWQRSPVRGGNARQLAASGGSGAHGGSRRRLRRRQRNSKVRLWKCTDQSSPPTLSGQN